MKDMGELHSSQLMVLGQVKTLKLSFPQVKRGGNPSAKTRKDSGQTGMTARRAFIYLVAGVIMALFLLLPSFSVVAYAEDSGFQFRKIGGLQSIQTKKPVRIKLKRTVKGEYSWELSGDDADEILRVDRQLREVLKQQQKQKDRGNARR